MLNILKYFQQTPVEKYEFQEAETLPFSSAMQASGLPEFADPSEEIEESVQEPQPDAASNYAEFARKLQEATEREAEEILDKARAEADAILESARTSANREAEALCEQMREKGYQEGFAEGRQAGYEAGQELGLEEGRAQLRAQQEQALNDVEHFFQEAANQRDMMFVRAQDQMRDLALTVAEKILRISLQSSGEIVARMVQHAVEKLKRREWVRVYISKGEVQRCVQADPELAAALAGLSDHVKIVPMESDDPGACIIEMPDEIIDASASTQMDNIRERLQDMKD